MAKSLAAAQHGGAPPQVWRLELFNRWLLLHDDDPVPVGSREQRLLALLALGGARARSYLAGVLWPDSSERHAGANLRESLSRIRHLSPYLVTVQAETLSLDTCLTVDLAEFELCLDQVAMGVDGRDLRSAVELLLQADLLPGWYEDWVLCERERIHQLRVRALENLAEVLVARDTGLALAAAMAAIRLDPLRDRAHRAVLRVHLADGNEVAALRHFESFQSQLRWEIGLAPSAATCELMRPLLRASGHLQELSGQRSQQHSTR